MSYRMNMESLKEKTLNWLDTLRDRKKHYGMFKMSKSTDATLFTSCFACFLINLFNELTKIPEPLKQEWLSYLWSYQDPKTGLFIDSDIKNRGLTPAHNWTYVTLQLTTFCLSAIKAMGGQPKFPLSFLESGGYLDVSTLERWLVNLDWQRPWGAGNMAMFIGIMLIFEYERNSSLKIKRAIDFFFDWHDAHQNPKTGFWGKGKTAEYHNGLFGAYHQYLLYFYMNRHLNYMDRIVDKILSFQNQDGMFAPQMGGGGCEDIDAIDTLVNIFIRTGYKKNKVEQCLYKAYKAILSLSNPKGGFIWGVRKRYGPHVYLKVLFSFLKNKDFFHWLFICRRFFREQITIYKPRWPNGWVSRPIPIYESDLFSTWFRLLAIALISKVIETPYSNYPWNFLTTPGLGWFKDIRKK